MLGPEGLTLEYIIEGNDFGVLDYLYYPCEVYGLSQKQYKENV